MKQPFQINIPQPVIDDLKARLAATRWVPEIDTTEWKKGTPANYLQELCQYWQKDYDWKQQEASLNRFQQYTSEVNGFNLHFIYQKGEGTKSIPLLLTHGWPDSFYRFYKFIPLLTKADENGFSFDVVVPSIPGYGFSDIPKKDGMNPKKIAGLFNQLMTDELGYKKYVAHGGDWGSSITEQLALYHNSDVIAIHLTDVPFAHGMQKIEDCSPAENKYLEETKMWQQTEGAYSSIQSTKPQSLAPGLNDSPAGLAAWIIEKFYAWSDNGGDIENAFTKDELLTNLTIYWGTQTVYSSINIYYEGIQAIMQAKYNPLVKLNPFDKTGDKSEVPAAFALFPKDIAPAPKKFAERFFNVQRWTEMKKGGHFAALEQPELLAADIREFVQNL